MAVIVVLPGCVTDATSSDVGVSTLGVVTTGGLVTATPGTSSVVWRTTSGQQPASVRGTITGLATAGGVVAALSHDGSDAVVSVFDADDPTTLSELTIADKPPKAAVTPALGGDPLRLAYVATDGLIEHVNIKDLTYLGSTDASLTGSTFDPVAVVVTDDGVVAVGMRDEAGALARIAAATRQVTQITPLGPSRGRPLTMVATPDAEQAWVMAVDETFPGGRTIAFVISLVNLTAGGFVFLDINAPLTPVMIMTDGGGWFGGSTSEGDVVLRPVDLATQIAGAPFTVTGVAPATVAYQSDLTAVAVETGPSGVVRTIELPPY
jgi:hypothetical protein